jgi:hypothetical protein
MPYQQVTLADLQAQLAARTDTNPWWTPEEARLALNEGLRIWNAATGRWVTKFPLRPVPNDPFVPLVGNVALPLRVLWNNIPLEKCGQNDLDYGFPGWRGATIATPGAPYRPVYWAPISLNLLVLYPAVDGITTALEVAAVQQTPLLVNPGDFIDLGQEEHDLLLGYALHVLTFSIGGQRFQLTLPKLKAFLEAAGAQNRQFAATSWYRRFLGLDAQRWFRPAERKVQNPVDAVTNEGNQG